MEAEMIESFKSVGYDGILTDENLLKIALDEGPKSSADFRNLIHCLAQEIHGLAKLEEKISKDDDYNTFMIELSALLKEMRCPFEALISGHVTERLQTTETRTLLLEYLISELMALKMSIAHKPEDKSNVITLQESPTASALKQIAIVLNFGKPPANIPAKVLFDKISIRLDEVIKTAGADRIGKPLFAPISKLSDEQWNRLAKVQQDLDTEYDLRRKMLLTRLDVTVQSFQWSEKIKGKEHDIVERYNAKRQKLDELQAGGESTGIPCLLAARDNLAVIEKTSSANVRKNTKSKIQRHVMGWVPDRGGRTWEQAPPPPEMPSWQKRTPGGGDRGGRGGGRGRGGGGGDRGGYNNHQSNQGNTGYQSNQGGNYQSNQGGGGGGGYQTNQSGGYQSNQDRQQSDQGFRGQGSGRGGGRVQGGWSQRGSGGNNQGYNNDNRGGRGNNSGGYDSSDRGSYGGDSRGRSNYNRGGRR